MRQPMLIVAVVLVGIPLGAAFLPIAARAQWNPPTPIVTGPLDEQTYPGSLALDGNDRFHVVWKESRPGTAWSRILYREGRPGHWDPDVVISLTGENFAPDLAVHRNGSSHVVWVTGVGNATEIRYATNASGLWKFEVVTSNATEEQAPAIAVDGDNRPHVAWSGFDASRRNERVFYARRDPGGWSVEVLAASSPRQPGVTAYPRIAVSGDGDPHVTYASGTGSPGTFRIEHAARVHGTWTYGRLPTPNFDDFHSSIRRDPYGRLHLAIGGFENLTSIGHIHSATSLDGGATWAPPDLVSGTHNATGPVLGVDAYGSDHVAWQEKSGSFLRGRIFHATNASGDWTNTPVTGLEENFRPSLAVDGSGFVHILYTFQVQTPTFPSHLYLVTNAQPTVTVTMSPARSTTVPRGETLPIDVTVTNETAASQEIDFWMTAIDPATGREAIVPSVHLGIPNPVRGAIPAGATVTRRIELRIPATAPARLLTLTANVGDAAAPTYLDRAYLWARVVP